MASYSEQLLKEGLKRSKWTNELERMNEARKYIDFYNFRQNDKGKGSNSQYSYMAERIAEMFPLTAGDMMPYICTYPLTEQIINDISIIYNRPPRLTVNPEQKLDPESPLVRLFMDEIVEKPLLYPTLLTVNRYVNLLGKVGVMPRWYENGQQLEYVILTPDKCFVLQDPDSPSHINAIIYGTDPLQDTPVATNKTNRWTMITAEEISEVEINTYSGAMNYKIKSTMPNPYKFIPVSWYQNSLPLDGFWNDKGNPIVDFNEYYNANKTLEQLEIIYQTYSTLVLVDMPAEKTITWGVKAVLNVTSDPTNPNINPDAKYITPNPKMAEVSAIIEGGKNDLAGYAGLSKEAFRKETNSFTSGYHLELSKQDVINQADIDKPFYTAATKDMLTKACKIYSTHSTRTLEAAQTFSIDYQDIVFKKNPIEVWQVRTYEKLNGVASPIDFIMEDNPDLTRAEAEERFRQVQKDLNEFGGVVSQMDADNNRNDDNMDEDSPE